MRRFEYHLSPECDHIPQGRDANDIPPLKTYVFEVERHEIASKMIEIRAMNELEAIRVARETIKSIDTVFGGDFVNKKVYTNLHDGPFEVQAGECGS